MDKSTQIDNAGLKTTRFKGFYSKMWSKQIIEVYIEDNTWILLNFAKFRLVADWIFQLNTFNLGSREETFVEKYSLEKLKIFLEKSMLIIIDL